LEDELEGDEEEHSNIEELKQAVSLQLKNAIKQRFALANKLEANKVQFLSALQGGEGEDSGRDPFDSNFVTRDYFFQENEDANTKDLYTNNNKLGRLTKLVAQEISKSFDAKPDVYNHVVREGEAHRKQQKGIY